MAVADKFIMSDETAKGLVNGIKVGGLWGRIGVYALLYVPASLVVGMIAQVPIPVGLNSHNPEVFLKFFGYFIVFAIPFILTELGIRSWRRKNGLSVNGNIAEELRQREVDLYVAREEKARGKLNSSETKDLEYWFGLLEKGAITEAQYNAKRDALLSE